MCERAKCILTRETENEEKGGVKENLADMCEASFARARKCKVTEENND